MADNEWGDLEAQTVLRLQDEKVWPVPEPIVKMAQRAVTGVPHPDDPNLLIHAFDYHAPTVDRAVAFVEHMRHAGKHTEPVSSIVVRRDPDRKRVIVLNEAGEPVKDDNGKVVREWGPPVDPKQVTFRAGERRGRK